MQLSPVGQTPGTAVGIHPRNYPASKRLNRCWNPVLKSPCSDRERLFGGFGVDRNGTVNPSIIALHRDLIGHGRFRFRGNRQRHEPATGHQYLCRLVPDLKDRDRCRLIPMRRLLGKEHANIGELIGLVEVGEERG